MYRARFRLEPKFTFQLHVSCTSEQFIDHIETLKYMNGNFIKIENGAR